MPIDLRRLGGVLCRVTPPFSMPLSPLRVIQTINSPDYAESRQPRQHEQDQRAGRQLEDHEAIHYAACICIMCRAACSQRRAMLSRSGPT